MFVTCEDVLKLEFARDFRFVGGAGGIHKPVRWIYVCQENNISPWVSGGELLFLTGIGIQRDEESLVSLVRTSREKNLAGIVVLLNELYIGHIPGAMIEEADARDLPLITMPWEIPIAVATREVASLIMLNQYRRAPADALFESVLWGGTEAPRLVQSEFQSAGYTFKKSNHILVIRSKTDQKPLAGQELERLKAMASDCFETPLICEKDGTLAILAGTDSENSPERLSSLFNSLRLSFLGPEEDHSLFMGIGGTIYSWTCAEFRQSYRQALNALSAYEIAPDTFNKGIFFFSWDDLGLLGLLFEFENPALIEAFYMKHLASLLDYDKKHNTDFILTLDIFLQENCNFLNTAKRLFIHRNTLNYRLTRIREITGKSFENAADKHNLYSGLLAMKLSQYRKERS